MRYGQAKAQSRLHAAFDGVSPASIAWRRGSLAAMTTFVAFAVALLAVTPVHRVAFASGALRPVDEIAVLRHVDGGEVVEIGVAAGAFVQPGDVLLRLEDPTLRAEAGRLAARRARLALERERLAALIEARPFNPPASDHLAQSQIEDARARFGSERAEMSRAASAHAARLDEIDGEKAANRAALRRLQTVVDAYREQVALSESLLSRQIGTRTAHLSQVAQLGGGEQRVAELEGALEAAVLRRARVVSEFEQESARRAVDWATAHGEVSRELADVALALADAQARIAALEVRAPIAGRVLELGATTPGDAVAPGALAARVVPADADGAPRLLAEVRISPDDIGFIAPGDVAEIDVSAFDADVFGQLSGTLEQVSPSALFTDEGEPFFLGTLNLERTEQRVGGAVLTLAPGMLAQAKFAVDDDTLLEYLLGPVKKALDVAFTEG